MNAALLRELAAAHQIIHNALNLMTEAQKHAWARLNAHDGVAGDGTTRANERESVIHDAIEQHGRQASAMPVALAGRQKRLQQHAPGRSA